MTQAMRDENKARETGKPFRIVAFSLIAAAAAALFFAALILPILRICGNSMSPALSEGDIVVSVRSEDLQTGDLAAFYCGSKILVKRVIAHPGDLVDIDKNGMVYVNSRRIDEPYIEDPSAGLCDIELPYRVPEGKVFVMGDRREDSVDSRNTAVGCVAKDRIIGKIIFRIWPFDSFGTVG